MTNAAPTARPRSQVAPSETTWSNFAAPALILLFVTALYAVRLTDQPVVGEESRWASGAQEMLATGDWIVPRQQGQPFPERPPMTMWLMAIAGRFRGAVDLVAIRLPSVIAIVLTSLLIYAYARTLISPIAAFIGAFVYASMGQVLQIGRMGESEAVFTLFVSASLMLWHLGYFRNWSPLLNWSVGFTFTALAALVKGPQAPVYFVAITAVYLASRRDWRYLFSWQFIVGGAIFTAIITAWQIPFYLATDWQTVLATWAGLTADRIGLAGLLEHIALYPLETFACLLPWSPILFALVKRETRDLVADKWPVVSFILIAVAIAYPTVWFVAGAQARYFMPLYPLIAVLIGLTIERCSVATLGRYPRRAWHQFLLVTSTLIATLSLAAIPRFKWALGSYQPTWFSLSLMLFAAAVIAALAYCYRQNTARSRILAVAAIALFAGIAQAGVLMNVNIGRWNDPTADVAELRSLLPPDTTLVSLTAIDHRFAYLYREPITELAWPRYVDDLPENVEYFCFMRDPQDTAEARCAGRGRSWTTTPGTLPFAWEEVATLCIERRLRNRPQITVVLGRVTNPRVATITDATKPHPAAVNLSATPNGSIVSR
jgi:4-amino-4-deoxy-L-arabinose transferase-like glycosyltransferase